MRREGFPQKKFKFLLEFLIGIRSHRLPHTQVPEISGKLNGKKSAFTWATSFLLRSLSAKSYKLFN
jgi:hypothetical protein